MDLVFKPRGDSFFCDPGTNRSRVTNIFRLFGAREVKGRSAYQLPRLEMIPRSIGQLPGINVVIERETETTTILGHPMWDKLYVQQKEAIEFFVNSPLSGTMIQLAPRLGKTPTAVVSAELIEAKTVLVVCPASLIPTWERETKIWGTGKCQWTIVSYDALARHVSDYRKKWDLLICDETILIKNRDTKRFKSLKSVRSLVKRCLTLTGSPVSKFADDYWAQLHITCPTLFSSYWRFAERYCLFHETPPWGREIVGSSDKKVVEDLTDVIFCRHHEDVGDAPQMDFETIFCPMIGHQSRTYDRALKDFIVALESGEEMSVPNRMAQLVRLQQIVSNTLNVDPAVNISSKSDTIVELLKESVIPLPLIIWVHWNKTGEDLLDRLTGRYKAGLVTGSSPNRDKTLEDFKREALDILIISIGVGKFGHTLANARSVVYHDVTWDMDAYNQSMFRVWVPGQTHRPRVFSLRSPNTVDDLIADNLETKAWGIGHTTGADLANLLKGLGRG